MSSSAVGRLVCAIVVCNFLWSGSILFCLFIHIIIVINFTSIIIIIIIINVIVIITLHRGQSKMKTTVMHLILSLICQYLAEDTAARTEMFRLYRCCRHCPPNTQCLTYRWRCRCSPRDVIAGPTQEPVHVQIIKY